MAPVVLLLGASVISAEPAVASSIHGRLLTASDLPAGWTTTHAKGSKEPGPCGLSVFRTATKSGQRVTATFTDGPTAFQEGLATGRGELSRWRSLAHHLASCHQSRLIENGKVEKLTIGTMSFPKVSRTSRAFELTLEDTDLRISVDVVLFRVPNYEGFVLYGTIGSLDVTTVERFARAAVAKAEGKAVHLTTTGGATGSGSSD